jgi:hypothetical protein
MRTLVVIAAAGLIATAVAWVGSGQASSDAVRRLAICHKTNSATRPYQRIVAVGARAIAAHQAHADDIIPAPRTCPQTLLTPTQGGTAFDVRLRGVSEQPEPADPDGAGTATLRMRAGQKRVCFTLNASNITLPAAGAHIHRGNADQSGDIVVPLTAPGASGTASGCAVAVRQLVSEILASPTSFYVNVHTTDFPAGALRAQLRLPTSVVIFNSPMSGTNERPNPGDADGTGTTTLQIFPDTGRLCYTMVVANVILPTVAAHIHRGGADIAGPVVVPFTGPDATGASKGCVTPDPALVRDIVQNPASFYTNAHTRDFPGGAVRGPISVATN